MEASCTFVASADWINQVVMLGSLLVAAVGSGVLGILRDRRLEAEQLDGDASGPESSMAKA
jgi:hypothetical protein